MQEENEKKNNPKLSENNEDEDSEWSLESLQELKGMSLNDLRQQEDHQPEIINKESQGNGNKKAPTVSYPPLQQLSAESQLHEVGIVIGNVGQLYIVEVNNMINIVDLENWLFDSKRQLIGFVIDVFGRVDKPYYAVKLKQGVSEMSEILHQKVYFGDGCKTLTEDDIKSIRAKSSIEVDGGMDQSDESDNDQPNNMYSQPNHPQRFQQRRRRRSFEEQPLNERQRTREKRNKPHLHPKDRDQKRGFQNQAYLENMYSTYYHQMMQLYQQGQQMPPPIHPSHFSPNQQRFPNPQFPPQNNFPQQSPFPSQNQTLNWPQAPKDFHQGNRPFPPH